MVWTAAEFKTETNLGKLSSRGTELRNIDRTLAAYHDLPGDAADNPLFHQRSGKPVLTGRAFFCCPRHLLRYSGQFPCLNDRADPGRVL